MFYKKTVKLLLISQFTIIRCKKCDQSHLFVVKSVVIQQLFGVIFVVASYNIFKENMEVSIYVPNCD